MGNYQPRIDLSRVHASTLWKQCGVIMTKATTKRQPTSKEEQKKYSSRIPKEITKNLPIFGLYTVFLCVYTCQCEYVHETSRYKCTSCSLNMCNFARNSYFKKRRKYISIANFLLGFVFVHHSTKADLCVCLFSYRCAFLTVLRSYEENSTSLALNVSKKTMNESHLSSSLVWKL